MRGTAGATSRVLVAGIGNVFLGDDGFGVEVARRLTAVGATRLGGEVDVVDYGIRGVHLAYELLDGRYGTLVMVDAVPMGEWPGTLAVLAVDGRATPPLEPADAFEAPAVDAHSMNPEAVLRVLRGLGGGVDRVLVIGCEPASIDARMGLSEPVAAVVDDAVRLVAEVVDDELARRGTPAEVG